MHTVRKNSIYTCGMEIFTRVSLEQIFLSASDRVEHDVFLFSDIYAGKFIQSLLSPIVHQIPYIVSSTSPAVDYVSFCTESLKYKIFTVRFQ